MNLLAIAACLLAAPLFAQDAPTAPRTPPASPPATPRQASPAAPPATPPAPPPGGAPHAPASPPASAQPPAPSSPSAPASPPASPTDPPPATAALSARFLVQGRGAFTIALQTAEAPMACANFANLVARGHYNGQPFDGWTRVIRQASGPTGLAGVGYTIRREFSQKLFFDGPGKVALQRMSDGEGAHPTVFFITTKEQDRWNLEFPVFALVSSGQAVVDSIQKGDIIDRVELQGDPAPLLKRFEAQVPQWNAALDAAIAKVRG